MSVPRQYIRRSRPVAASVEWRQPVASSRLASLLDQQLRYGHPSARHGGRLIAPLVARPLPTRAFGTLLSLGVPRADPALDRLVEDVLRTWPRLAATSPRLPPHPPELAILAVRRRASRTVFLVDPSGDPLIVAKLPHVPRVRDPETTALTRAAPSDVVPRPLGVAGRAWLQEGRPGTPPRLRPLHPDAARRLPFTTEWAGLAAGLTTLAATTLTAEPPRDLPQLLAAAADFAPLPAHVAAQVRRAASDLSQLSTSVLGHGDLSAQNWLVHRSGLSGIVDWTEALHRAGPGFDVLHAAVTYLEQSVGLRQWSPSLAVAAFEAAWPDSPLVVGVRRAFREIATAGGVPDHLHDALEVGYFARRLGYRLVHDKTYLLPAESAARLLRHICMP